MSFLQSVKKLKRLLLNNKSLEQKGGGDIVYNHITIKNPGNDDEIEPQQSLGCGRHALNNLFRNPNTKNHDDVLFIKGSKNDLFDINSQRPTKKISLYGICNYIKPYDSYCQDNENYDITVLMFALMYAGYNVDEFGIYKKNTNNIAGIVNTNGGHWVSIVQDNDKNWFEYDSLGVKKSNIIIDDYIKLKKISNILFINKDKQITSKDLINFKINTAKKEPKKSQPTLTHKHPQKPLTLNKSQQPKLSTRTLENSKSEYVRDEHKNIYDKLTDNLTDNFSKLTDQLEHIKKILPLQSSNKNYNKEKKYKDGSIEKVQNLEAKLNSRMGTLIDNYNKIKTIKGYDDSPIKTLQNTIVRNINKITLLAECLTFSKRKIQENEFKTIL